MTSFSETLSQVTADADRPILRALATAFHSAIREAANNQQNVHQLRLDLNDQTDALFSSFDVESQIRVRTVYAQELDALTAETERKTQEALERRAKADEETSNAAAILGGLFVLFGLIYLFTR